MRTKDSLSVVGGISLIAGTCIGSGALLLPLTTYVAGFWPSIALFAISWLAMCLTGLLYLEAVLWMPGETNILSMAQRFLGRVGRIICWFVYLTLFYSLTISYVSGSGDVLTQLSHQTLPRPLLITLFVLLFGALVYRGTKAVEGMNFLLVLGLAIAYVLLIGLGLPEIKPILLAQSGNWLKALPFLPIILTSFGYQGTVPSLVADMENDFKKARLAIIFGSLLPLVAYSAWQAFVMGVIPPKVLAETFEKGTPVVEALSQSPTLLLIGEFFAFFALASSFLGVGLGLRDFLADGFKVKKTRSVRFWICVLIYGPAFVISISRPGLFRLALQYGGGIGGVLLLGILPVLLVWVGRYIKKCEGPYRLRGGRGLLAVLGLFVLFALVAELLAE